MLTILLPPLKCQMWVAAIWSIEFIHIRARRLKWNTFKTNHAFARSCPLTTKLWYWREKVWRRRTVRGREHHARTVKQNRIKVNSAYAAAVAAVSAIGPYLSVCMRYSLFFRGKPKSRVEVCVCAVHSDNAFVDCESPCEWNVCKCNK